MNYRELGFTGLYAGYARVAPGTAGTLVGMVLYILEYLILGKWVGIVHAVIVLLLIYPAIKLADEGERFFGVKDPPQVVIDEVMGYWTSMILIPFSWKAVLAAFFVFRLIDIIKPFPAGRIQKLRGGFGIMADDYIAGIYTNIIIRILFLIMDRGALSDLFTI